MKYVLFLFLFVTYSFAQIGLPFSEGQELIYANKLDQAITYYKGKDNPENSAIQHVAIHMGLAEAYKLKLDYNSANECYVKAFQNIQISKDIQLQLFYHVKMVEFYRKRVLFKKALEQQKIADKIVKSSKISLNYLPKYYNRKAALFAEYYKIPDSTLFYSKKSLQLALINNDKDDVFYSTLEIAGVLEQQKELNEAILYLENLIEFSKKNNLIQQRVDAYTNYSRILIKNKNYTKALDQTLIALNFSEKNGMLYSQILFLDNLSVIYQELNKSELAYDYLKKRLELTDIYYQKEHNKFLFDLEAKYNTIQKEKQIAVSSLEIENQKKTLANNAVKLYAILGILLFVFLFALLISYFLKKSKKINKELHFLATKNEFLLDEANHRINNNLQLITILIADQLNNLSDKESKEIKKILTKINSISALHRHLYLSNDTTKVNSSKYLNDIHDNFYDLFFENSITANIEIESVELPTDVAMYLGLMVTELYINSIKHAFKNIEFKEINLFLVEEEGFLFFEYSDNGNANNKIDFTPKLIDKLCQQLKIKSKINLENGFHFSFKLNSNFK